MSRTKWWMGLWIALVLAPGCKKDEGGACFHKAACAEGLACVGDGLRRCEKCEGLEQCTVDGQCTPEEGACVAASDEECKSSYGCKERGPCTAKNGVCVVGGDADCQQSQACAREKYCVAQGNNCVASEADKRAAAKANADAAAKLAQDGQVAAAARKE